MKRILVTGCCGFIGSNLVHYLLKTDRYIEIVGIDLLTYAGNLDNLKDVMEDPRFAFFRADVADHAAIDQIFSATKPDAVIHLAAESHVDRSIDDAAPFVRTNVIGTQVMLDAAVKHGVKRFLQVSTDEVYGSLGAKGSFDEQSPIKPHSPYSASKAAADHLVQSYHDTYGFHTLITRCSNNYGPFQFPEKLLPVLITNCFDGKDLPIYGDGRNVRDWIHVEDHCEAIWLVLRRGKAGEVYNIGGNCERTNMELAHAICKATDTPKSKIKRVADRLGHDRRYAIDAGKMWAEFGWQSGARIEERLDDLIQWYRDHEQWWRGLK